MKLFHDEEEKEVEPVRGLPAQLPEGEEILWQGGANSVAFATEVFHVRLVSLYFVGLTALKLAGGGAVGPTIVGAMMFAGAALALLFALAFFMSRSAVFTITNKRVVLRFGVAIPKFVNIPFGQIERVAFKPVGKKSGNIALFASSDVRLGYLRLWPFVRPLSFGKAVPLMRCVADAATASSVLIAAMKKLSPQTVKVAANLSAAANESGPQRGAVALQNS